MHFALQLEVYEVLIDVGDTRKKGLSFLTTSYALGDGDDRDVVKRHWQTRILVFPYHNEKSATMSLLKLTRSDSPWDDAPVEKGMIDVAERRLEVLTPTPQQLIFPPSIAWLQLSNTVVSAALRHQPSPRTTPNSRGATIQDAPFHSPVLRHQSTTRTPWSSVCHQ